MRSSAAAAGQFLAGRAVDGQTEKVARLAEVSVPITVCDEVDKSQKVEEEDCEEDEEEAALVSSSTT